MLYNQNCREQFVSVTRICNEPKMPFWRSSQNSLFSGFVQLATFLNAFVGNLVPRVFRKDLLSFASRRSKKDPGNEVDLSVEI